MNLKFLFTLLLYLYCSIFGFSGSAFAEKNRIPAEPGTGTSSVNDSNFQNKVGSEYLTLEEALGLTLKHNPVLEVYAAEIRARDAAAIQSGLLPNPDLEVGVENFAGEDELKNFDGAETTIVLSQLIELGGKRDKRSRVAVLEKDLAAWDYQSQKRDVLASAAKTFIEVLLAQEQAMLNHDLVKLAEQTAAAVTEKADAGKVSPVEKIKVRVELASARSEAGKASRELEAAKRRLAGFWGSDSADFERVLGNLTPLTDLPAADSLKSCLPGNPDLARWKSETARNEAALELASSESFPDLTLSAGIRNFRETGDKAFLAGISLPIPVFNRNQGGIAEARERMKKVKSGQRAAEVTLLSRFSETWQRLAAAYEESATLRDSILPGAQDAYESTDAGYREGKLDYLEMLDAQRTLFFVKRQYLVSLGSYHMARTDMERLIGVSLDETEKKTEGKNNDEN